MAELLSEVEVGSGKGWVRSTGWIVVAYQSFSAWNDPQGCRAKGMIMEAK